MGKTNQLLAVDSPLTRKVGPLVGTSGLHDMGDTTKGPPCNQVITLDRYPGDLAWLQVRTTDPDPADPGASHRLRRPGSG